MLKKMLNFAKEHPYYNSFVHLLIGTGFGILITYPYIGDHPVRWGVGFIALGVLGHLYPLFVKK